MVRCFVFVSLCLWCGGAFARGDSLSLLFDGVVREYSLIFYQADWQAQLKANYTAGENAYLPARFTDGAITLDSVGVRYKGNSSYNAALMSPKKPFKIKFNKFIPGQLYYDQEELNFSNGYGDPSFLREVLAYDLFRRYMPSPKAGFAVLRAGTAQSASLIGLYTQVQQVGKDFLEDWFPDATQNLFKAGDAGANLAYLGRDPLLYASSLELKTNEESPDWTGMIRFLSFLNDSTRANWCFEARQYLDLNRTTAFLALSMALSHFDSYIGSGRNFYLYQTTTGHSTLIPWDMNLAFGAYSNNWNVYSRSAVALITDRPLFNRVLGCDSLRWMYLAYIREFIRGPGSEDSLRARVDSLAALIRPYVQADPNKFYALDFFEKNLTDKVSSASGTIPGIIEFTRTRNANLLTQVDSLLPEEYVLPVKKRFPEGRGSLRLRAKRLVNLLGRVVHGIHE